MYAIDSSPHLAGRIPAGSTFLDAPCVVVTGLNRDVRRHRVMASVTARRRWAHLTNPSMAQAEQALTLFRDSAIFLDFSDAHLFWTVVGAHASPATQAGHPFVIYSTDATASEGRSAAARVRGWHIRLSA